MHTKGQGLTIGALARQAGVNVETIRYYQRIGLLFEPPKPAQGYRRYPQQEVSRVHFIKRAQELGFSLKEIAGLLQLNDGNCSAARHMAEQKRELVNTRLNDLKRLYDTLSSMIDACRQSEANGACCALIDTLTRNPDRPSD
ncbi:MerR family mercuric resistance operon transcriptional regulator [Thiogranum longum]|uniref:Mercuric resistance operon regulatory protein n=1 Tax=Thiogranum longum TaxID=1537524 RepID=A0A4R1HCH6_9GAMM|nr:MerR family transcriptional regulator [Thiogranum longum]TCK18331.1 MerR family mercuric resistance operon transcriptional regulator [Thiogranum longum]